MSADNWRSCPRCALEKSQEATKAEEKAKKSYGKVSAEKFMELLAAAKTVRAESDAYEDAESKHTFREDYQVGVNIDGVFSVSYSGKCNQCSYSVAFSEKKTFPPEK